jgi:hypothetical protein
MTSIGLKLDAFLRRDEGRRSLLLIFVLRRATAVDGPPVDLSGVGWSLVPLTFDHSKETGEGGRKEGER